MHRSRLRSTVPVLVFALTLIPTSARATTAAGSISVGAHVNVTRDLYAENEESLGMSPNGRLLAGAWNDWNYNDGCGFSYSTNGGASWAPKTFVPGLTAFTNDPSIPGTGQYGIAGDPAVAFNPRFGVFDVVCQSFGGNPSAVNLLATTFDQSVANPVADENASYGADAWTRPTSVTTGKSNGSQKGHNGQFPDHESITVDTGTGAGHHYGRLYVSWAMFNGNGRSPIEVAFSDDDGFTWTGPILVSDKDHTTNQDARVSIAPDGTLYMTFLGGPNETSLKHNFVAVARSRTGGRTWSSTHEVAPIVAPIPGVLPNSSYRDSSDVTASIDRSTGRLVLAFTDAKSGASQVYAVHQRTAADISDWSTPRRVKPSGREQFFPWMSSAPDGRIDLVFYDRTCDPGDTANCVTLSSSWDTGRTWTSTSLLSTPFDGDTFDACLAFVQASDCGIKFLGDYIAVGSTNSNAVSLFTGNGPNSQDVFSVTATFP
jgi:BNR repeat-like domain